jgi:hypothetical protein
MFTGATPKSAAVPTNDGGGWNICRGNIARPWNGPTPSVALMAICHSAARVMTELAAQRSSDGRPFYADGGA